MTEADLDQVARLEADLFGAGGWSRAVLEEEFHAPARHYLVDVIPANDGANDDVDGGADDGANDTVRGYAGYWYDGDDAELMTVGVGTAWQNQGIAGRLLDRLLADATADGARRMLLEVRTDNEPALAVYRRRGFERIGLRRRYYQPENKDAYVMAVQLGERIVGFAPAAQNQPAQDTAAQDQTAQNQPAQNQPAQTQTMQERKD
ncbi:ribosomal protein S18-alanine N-acetyltransferase [Pseudoscardovia radai]|uniref:ribosomal protein S18-alanine N-acetyltransferase n=1 Tax=Pseudoscardovia radai TaxID=987066 RepID=UPI003993A260